MDRDWDLFAAPALLFTVLTAREFVALPAAPWRGAAWCMLLAASAVHTLSFVTVNHDTDAAARRALALTERSRGVARAGLVGHNYFQLSNYYRRQGDADKALEFLHEAARVSRSPHYYHRLGHFHYKRQELGAAASYYDTALQLDPTRSGTLINMGTTQYDMGNYREALRYLRRAVQTLPDTGYLTEQSHRMVSLCHGALNEPAEAREALLKALALNPGNPLTYYDLSVASRALGDTAAARSYYARAVSRGLRGTTLKRRHRAGE
jgi:tetratricopeptide (TPR) repeat protein